MKNYYLAVDIGASSGRHMLGRIMLGLDVFDASISRIAAWTVGMRNFQEALFYGLLTPNKELAKLQDENRLTEVWCFRKR